MRLYFYKIIKIASSDYNTGFMEIDNRYSEKLMKKKHCKELMERLGLINREIIFLIDAKKRYEKEIEEYKKDIKSS